MKEKILLLVIMICVLTYSVYADDLYGYVGLYTDNGNVYVNIDSNAINGSVHNYYNGEKLVSPPPNNKMSDNTLYHKIGDIFFDYSYSSREWRPKTKFKTYTQQIAHESFSMYFMPREEVYQELGKLKFEIMVLQEQLIKNDCDIRKELMLKHNLQSIECGTQTYINHNGSAVTIESLIPTPIVPKPKIPAPPKEYTPDSINRYQELCDAGLEKFCKVISLID